MEVGEKVVIKLWNTEMEVCTQLRALQSLTLVEVKLPPSSAYNGIRGRRMRLKFESETGWMGRTLPVGAAA